MYYDDGHMGDGWGVFMVVTMLVILAVLAFALVWLVRSTRTPTLPPPTSSPSGTATGAEQILAERLARGEIDPEDYQARLAALRAHH